MSDNDAVIALCQKLGLKRIDTDERYGVDADEFWVVSHPDSTSQVLIGSGKDGYSGFYAAFDFDAAGNLVSHGVFE